MTLPTIPQYFQEYVDPTVDLTATPHIPCPFHGEVHGKSFSYSADKQVWRCFGECHCGGDVIELHKLNKKFKTREEAKLSLYAIYHIKDEIRADFTREPVQANTKLVYRNRVYNLALKLAKTPDDWVELDYLLSQDPFDVADVAKFCKAHGLDIEPVTGI